MQWLYNSIQGLRHTPNKSDAGTRVGRDEHTLANLVQTIASSTVTDSNEAGEISSCHGSGASIMVPDQDICTDGLVSIPHSHPAQMISSILSAIDDEFQYHKHHSPTLKFGLVKQTALMVVGMVYGMPKELLNFTIVDDEFKCELEESVRLTSGQDDRESVLYAMLLDYGFHVA
jgi:hypothetical protein